jgi:hypothetical protein
MKLEQPVVLQLPSFLHGSFSAVERKALEEGRRHVTQYQKSGTFHAPLELVEVAPGELLVAHEVADFDRDRPMWRPYMLFKVISGLCEALDWKNASQVSDSYEAATLKMPWGALYFVTAQEAPMSAERMALRIRALLRFWEPLQSVRYIFKALNTGLSLEELMIASCDWAMDAWDAAGDASVRARLEVVAGRMAQATREDSIEAILRQMPRVLTYARDLKHASILAQPAFWRQRITALDANSFEHISAACTSDLLEQLYAWDRQLGRQ